MHGCLAALEQGQPLVAPRVEPLPLAQLPLLYIWDPKVTDTCILCSACGHTGKIGDLFTFIDVERHGMFWACGVGSELS